MLDPVLLQLRPIYASSFFKIDILLLAHFLCISLSLWWCVMWPIWCSFVLSFSKLQFRLDIRIPISSRQSVVAAPAQWLHHLIIIFNPDSLWFINRHQRVRYMLLTKVTCFNFNFWIKPLSWSSFLPSCEDRLFTFTLLIFLGPWGIAGPNIHIKS